VATALQLTKDALSSHLALEVLDRSLDTLVANNDFNGFALDGFNWIRAHADTFLERQAATAPGRARKFARGSMERK
jgi:hypothetical protein